MPPSFRSDQKSGLSWFSHVRWQHLVAGVSGGVASTLVLQPLDLVKVRFQVDEGPGKGAKRPAYRGLTHAISTIYKQRGIPGLYQGVTPNLVGAGSSWGLYFLFYNSAKSYMQAGDTSVALDASHHIAAASFAGVLTLGITNPVWVTKTRLYLQYDQGSTSGATRYKGMTDALIKIGRQEGVRGLYKGFVAGLFGVSHGALQFMAYEELKNRYNQYKDRPINVKLTALEYLTFAALSKMFAVCATYPYQVVRSRLQDQHRVYSGNMDVIVQTWRGEGARGFYKGLWPNLVRVTPACCITFVVYEKLSAWLMPVKS